MRAADYVSDENVRAYVALGVAHGTRMIRVTLARLAAARRRAHKSSADLR